MRFVLFLTAVAIAAPAYAQIELRDVYAAYEPITATLANPIPKGAEVDGRWTVTDGECRPAGLDKQHVWAAPGEHLLAFRGVWIKTRTAILEDGQPGLVLEGFGFLDESAEFTVEGVPGPPPPPVPDGRRWGMIIVETEDQTPEQANLWRRIRAGASLGEIQIVDQNSQAAPMAPFKAAIREHPLPALVVVTALDDGSGDDRIIRVVPCPGSLAETRAEINRK